MAILVRSTGDTPLPVAGPRSGIGRIRKVALLGSHRSVQYAPWTDPSWEFWGHASSRRWYGRVPDRYFDLHRRECWTANGKGTAYLAWLKTNAVPIVMQEQYPEVPASRRYPKEMILAQFRPYFTGHAAWMIALALSEGVTHLGLFGVNYSHESEYGTQRGSCEYWLGYAEGRGVQIVLPDSNTLMREPATLYGYQSHDATGKLVAAYRPTMTKQQTIDRRLRGLDDPHLAPLVAPPSGLLTEGGEQPGAMHPIWKALLHV